jgi:hypothetical protein
LGILPNTLLEIVSFFETDPGVRLVLEERRIGVEVVGQDEPRVPQHVSPERVAAHQLELHYIDTSSEI